MSSPLRILVPVKRVIDYAIKPRPNKSLTAIVTAGVKHSLNPFDELSIEAAVRLRELSSPPPRSSSSPSPSHPTPHPSTPPVSDILALSIGPAKCVDVLRTAMAMGADRALHVLVDEDDDAEGGGSEGGEVRGELEPLAVAKVLREVVRREGSNLVILGKQSIDGDNGQTGAMLAGLLGWGQATQASKITFLPGSSSSSSSSSGGEAEGTEGVEVPQVEVICEVDGGVETLRGKLPMVITTDLRLNEPRYASLPNIMKAKKKVLERKRLGDFFGGEGEKGPGGAGRRLRVLRVEEPPPRKGGGKVADVDGMISKLKELGAI